MTCEPVLESLARQYLLEHWEAAVASTAAHEEDDAAVGLAMALRPCCVTSAVLGELLRMMSNARHQHAKELSHEIREHITDHLFLDECGDPPEEYGVNAIVDEQVSVMVDVLERVRCEAIARGIWSTTPVAEQWFG